MDHSVESKSQSMVCDLDNLQATELRLGLPGNSAAEKPTLMASRGGKRSLSEAEESFRTNGSFSESGSVGSSQEEEEAPLAKTQVVGWPPVRSYRRNSFQARNAAEAEDARIYVKVSMDGAPYMRKIDLKVYKGYKELREAMEDMFKCFTSKEQIDERNGCEHAIIYEDKDGDWMLVGDVPWEMLISSCKRLRIMRGMESRGLVQSYEG